MRQLIFVAAALAGCSSDSPASGDDASSSTSGADTGTSTTDGGTTTSSSTTESSSEGANSTDESFSNWCPGDVIDRRIIVLGPTTAGEHEFVIDVPDATFADMQGDFPFSLYLQAARKKE